MTTAPFSPEDLLRYVGIEALSSAPDAGGAVVEVSDIDVEADASRTRLWWLPFGGCPRALTHGEGDTQAQLSPDGRRVAFTATRGGKHREVWLIATDGGEARALTSLGKSVVSLAWSPDGAFLLATVREPVDPGPRSVSGRARGELDVEIVWRPLYKSDGAGYILDRNLALYWIDAASGEASRIVHGAFDVRGACASPDGARIAYVRTRSDDEPQRTDLWVAKADGSQARRVVAKVAHLSSPAWSPDGRCVVFGGSEREGDSIQRPWLWFDGSDEVRPLGDEDVEIEPSAPIVWTPDSRHVVVLLTRRGMQEIARIALGDGTLERLVTGRRHVLAFAMNGRRIAFAACAPDAPVELHECAPDGSDERKASDFNAWWCERTLPRVEYRRFEVPDGRGGQELIDAWLLLPAAGEGPFPLLINGHGGPHSYALVDYNARAHWQVLASRGWAILGANTVGSSSYGREFAERLRGHWGELDTPQQLACVRALQREGLADARVAMTGKSYGGFLTAWMIGNADVLRAAVVSAPVANHESHYATSDSGFYVNAYAIGGEAWEKREVSRRLSPVQHVHRARTPTLFLQGSADQRCPLGQSEELFVTMHRASEAPVEMVIYPEGSHHLAEDGRPSHRVDYYTRLVDWVERFAAGRESSSETGSVRATAKPGTEALKERAPANSEVKAERQLGRARRGPR